MNDVNMNTVQQVAAKWVQSAQTAETKETQAVQNPLDFSENNVTMATARKTVAPRGILHLDAPKTFVGADNAVLLQRNVISAANSFRAFGANQDRRRISRRPSRSMPRRCPRNGAIPSTRPFRRSG